MEEGRSAIEISIASFFLVVLIILTLAGNITVIMAATTYRRLKEQQSNMFIVNLAIADLCVVFLVMSGSLIGLVTDMKQVSGQPPLIGNVLCNIQCAMNYCLIVVSMMTLGFVSLDRLAHIVYPLRYATIMTIPKIRLLIVWTWIQGIIIGFTPVITSWIHYDYFELVCAIEWSHLGAVTYVIVAFITCFAAPGLTMLICYSLMLKEIKRSMSRVSHEGVTLEAKKTKSSLLGSLSSKASLFGLKASGLNAADSVPMPNQQQRTSTNQHKRIVRSLLVVVFVFFICMTPFCVTKLIKVLNGSVAGWVNTMATFVQLTASASNPFIYGIFRNEFRRAFRAQYNKLLYRLGCKDHMLNNMSRHSSGVSTIETANGKRKAQPKHSATILLEQSVAEQNGQMNLAIYNTR